LRDIGTNGIAVRFMITDGRPGRDFQQHYVARMKAGVRGWSVVELRRMSTSPGLSSRASTFSEAESS
jgi:hypothetical protein